LAEGEQRRQKAAAVLVAGKVVNARNAPLPVPITLAEEAKNNDDKNKTAELLKIEIVATLAEAATPMTDDFRALLRGCRKGALIEYLVRAREVRDVHVAAEESRLASEEALAALDAERDDQEAEQGPGSESVGLDLEVLASRQLLDVQYATSGAPFSVDDL